MNLSLETVRAIRAYVFDYVVGVLWLLSFCAFVGSSVVAHVVSVKLAPVVVLSRDLSLPDIAVGLIVFIAGVILPYSLGVALTPVTTLLLNTIVYLQNRISFFQFASRLQLNPEQRLQLYRLVANRVQRQTSWNGPMTRNMRSVLLQAWSPEVCARLDRLNEDLRFRAAAIFPSSLLIAALVYRTLPAARMFSGVSAGCVVFALGVLAANRHLANHDEALNMGLLLGYEKVGERQNPSNSG